MEGLIKLTGEENLFYDSIERVYRYRMHCPYCGKLSGCRCFNTLDKAEDFSVDSTDFVCSSKCSLECLIDEQGTDDIIDSMREMGFQTWSGFWYASFKDKILYGHIAWIIKSYAFKYFNYFSEKDASEVLCFMDLDWDSVEGESC